MSARDKKAKKGAKQKRKDFRERMKLEQANAKQRKLEKAERNRRFAGQESKMRLPEDSLYFDSSFLEKETKETLENLFDRQFFFRLEEKLEKNECRHELLHSIGLLQGMGLGKKRMDEIKEMFVILKITMFGKEWRMDKYNKRILF